MRHVAIYNYYDGKYLEFMEKDDMIQRSHTKFLRLRLNIEEHLKLQQAII